jgi:hypothetical protein
MMHGHTQLHSPGVSRTVRIDTSTRDAGSVVQTDGAHASIVQAAHKGSPETVKRKRRRDFYHGTSTNVFVGVQTELDALDLLANHCMLGICGNAVQ